MRTTMCFFAQSLVFVAALQMISAAVNATEHGLIGITASTKPIATYERFLPLAEAGDPAMQNILGFMHFNGEGVELDYEAAHYWFHLASEEGDLMAQRNLGIFHSRLLPHVPEQYYDSKEANLWFSLAAASSRDPKVSTAASRSYDKFLDTDAEKLLKEAEERYTGETIYVTFCAGCHGFDGHAPYHGAPSFALGQGLKQSDHVLVGSILNGKGPMPGWGNTISKELAFETVSYIRRFDHSVAGAAQVAVPRTSQQFAQDEWNDLESGEKTYLQFCGGCHGFNGIAWYVNSPSFALRERMHKGDKELAYSIRKGRGVMPSWENMLGSNQIDTLVRFIRTLSDSYESGIGNELRRPPGLFFRFRPKGETDPEWNDTDL